MRAAILLLAVMAIAYFGLTWYRYGSSHPCGILKSMKMPYRVEVERRAAMALERQHSQRGEASRFEDPEIRKLIQQDWQRIRAAPEIAAAKLDKEISPLTLGQCISEVLTSRSPAGPGEK